MVFITPKEFSFKKLGNRECWEMNSEDAFENQLDKVLSKDTQPLFYPETQTQYLQRLDQIYYFIIFILRKDHMYRNVCWEHSYRKHIYNKYWRPRAWKFVHSTGSLSQAHALSQFGTPQGISTCQLRPSPWGIKSKLTVRHPRVERAWAISQT